MYERIQRARELRRNLTEQEQFVWSKLRGRRFHEFKFRRQVPMGVYVADFVCLKQWLIIELDGGQHNETERKDDDAARDLWFRKPRISNASILESRGNGRLGCSRGSYLASVA